MYPFPGKQWAFLGLFRAHGNNFLIKNMVHTCVFEEKFVILLGNMQETNALEANIGSFDKISVKYLPSHTQALVS